MAYQLRKCLHVHNVALDRVVRAPHDGLCVSCHVSSPFPKVRGQTLPADHMVFFVRVVSRRHQIQVIDDTRVGHPASMTQGEIAELNQAITTGVAEVATSPANSRWVGVARVGCVRGR